MTELATTAGMGTSQRLKRRTYPSAAPMRVAMLPKMTSQMMAPPRILASRQPINNPGMAAGVNSGRMVSISAIRTCMAPKEIGANTNVSTT